MTSSPRLLKALYSLIENVVGVWNDLKERCLQGDSIRVAALYQDISNFKQGDLRVSKYFTEMTALWKEFDQFKPMLWCTSPRAYVCAAMCNARNFKKEDQIIQFLDGLNEQYTGVKSQILLKEPFLTINRVFSIVLQEERQQIYRANNCPEVKNEEIDALANSIESRNANWKFSRGWGYISKRNRSRQFIQIKCVHLLWKEWPHSRCML